MDEPHRGEIMLLPGNINVRGNNVMPTAFAGCFSAPFSTIISSLREFAEQSMASIFFDSATLTIAKPSAWNYGR